MFSWKAAWGEPVPGNFLELKVNDSTAPMLRRPFAFSDYSAENETASIIYQVRGTSTNLLTQKREGDEVRIIGPLGNGFTIDSDAPIIAVGGGVGLGPILFAAKVASKAGKKVSFITGFRSSELVPDRFLWEGLDATICTDNGSEGFAGNVVQYLQTLPSESLAGSVLISCGPTPMLRACHTFAEQIGISCEVSMEELMACGIGACMGCVCETKTEAGLARVCKEGPIFKSEVIKWS
jgi:dihydroorotate dehydrogenase electron transfer subunit